MIDDERIARDLALWMVREQGALGARIRRMPKRTLEQREARAIAAVQGMREIGPRYRRLKRARLLEAKDLGRYLDFQLGEVDGLIRLEQHALGRARRMLFTRFRVPPLQLPPRK